MENKQKTRLINIQGKIILMSLIVLLGCVLQVSAWSTNSFDINNSCYQETANISTFCGGLSTGNYNIDNRYFNINYTKPTNSLGALWMVKYGVIPTYNISIPNDCWNYDASKVILRIIGYRKTPTNEFYSYPQCYNASWKTIGDNSTSVISTAGFLAPISNFYDGNWDTSVYYNDGDNYYYIPSGSPNGAPNIYEEAIYWNISNVAPINFTFYTDPDIPDIYTQYLKVPSGNLLSKAYLNLSGWETEFYPRNPAIKIGNIANAWNYTGNFNMKNNRTYNLANAVNSYLSICTYSDGYCYVPFNFSASAYGSILQISDFYFDSEGIGINSISYNSTSYETSTETFNIDLTYDNLAYTSISTSLIYNGTTYSSTKIGTGSNIQFTRSLGLNSVGNKSFYWRIGLTNSSGVTYYNSNTNYQNVLPIQLGLCNSTLNRTYLNITFKDETYDIYMNASIPYSTFIYSLGDYSYNKTFTLINATENRNYPICFSPVDKSVNIDAYFQYSAVGYPQRIYNPDSLTYTNSTTQKVLYLSSVGQTVSFQVINGAGQPISGVEATATRIIGSETVVVGNGITNGAGIVSFWLNYNFEHTIVFVKSGYTSYTFITVPTNTEYTITLGGTAVSINDYTQGITNKINPSNDFLDNNTIYNFNYTLSSTYWDVEEFGFSLYYQNGTLIGSQTAYSNGGIINLNADTSNQSTIYMNYYYIINSNLTTGSRTWIIQTKPSAGIWRFFQDLNRYTNLGFYGFDNFGKAILSILIILLVAGGLSARYGMASESAIMGLVFGIVSALDYNNFIPKMNIGGIIPIDHFITFITFMIMMVMIIREER